MDVSNSNRRSLDARIRAAMTHSRSKPVSSGLSGATGLCTVSLRWFGGASSRDDPCQEDLGVFDLYGCRDASCHPVGDTVCSPLSIAEQSSDLCRAAEVENESAVIVHTEITHHV